MQILRMEKDEMDATHWDFEGHIYSANIAVPAIKQPQRHTERSYTLNIMLTG